jgi:hypothetical protein
MIRSFIGGEELQQAVREARLRRRIRHLASHGVLFA